LFILTIEQNPFYYSQEICIVHANPAQANAYHRAPLKAEKEEARAKIQVVGG
jgi:hypothetical protein